MLYVELLRNNKRSFFPLEEGYKFFDQLEKVCNICHKESFGSIFGEMCIGHNRDVLDLIKTLKNLNRIVTVHVLFAHDLPESHSGLTSDQS